MAPSCRTVCSTSASSFFCSFRRGIGPLDLSRRQGFDDVLICRTTPKFLPLCFVNEGPSCIFVGPLETADRDRLEALYKQARDSYYSGCPLIMDYMFDKVEVQLRWQGSKSILKYPRCSLRRHSVYADAEIDVSQTWTLATLWSALLGFGVVIAVGPLACAFNKACTDSMHARFGMNEPDIVTEGNIATFGLIGMTLCLVLGAQIGTAAAQSLLVLWKGGLLALKGSCPNCSEEVYAFVAADKPSLVHKTECHVCGRPLAFKVKVKKSRTPHERPKVYGRVYLGTRASDLLPKTIIK